MTNLTLDQAAAIIEAAFDKGCEDGLAPLTVAVLDAGGHMVAFMRQDDSGILRPEIANGKAYGALGFGLPDDVLVEFADDLARRERFDSVCHFVLSISCTTICSLV